MSKQVNYNENLCSGAAIRDDKGRRISKLFEASHPKMTVGYAKNLIMPDTPTEQEFNFRQAGGGVIEDGVAVIDKVKGKSLVWNQLFDGTTLKASGTRNGITFTYENGVITANGTATATAFSDSAIDGQSIKLIKGHKYIFAEKTSNANAFVQLFCGITEEGVENIALNNEISEIVTCDYISSGIYADGWLFRVRVASGTTLTNAKFRMPFTDLTQMFGAGNEPTTYEDFLQRKPKVADEFAYNEGEVVHNHTTAVKGEGVNLWDGTLKDGSGDNTALIKALPNTRYHILSGNPVLANWEGWFSVTYYNADKSKIGELRYGLSYVQNEHCYFTTPQGCAYFDIERLGLIENSISVVDAKICINISDPAINGQYFPYEKHELDLSWVKEIKDSEGVKLFEDGMRSAGTTFDEVRKDKAVKRLGSVDLGSLSWVLGTSPRILAPAPSDVAQPVNPSLAPNAISARYNAVPASLNFDTQNKVFTIVDDTLVVADSDYSDAASFKAAMSGVMLYYELAEPIEVEYDEKNLTYPVVAGGTEEAIASEPSSAFRADIGYGIDAVKTILDLKARVGALEGK